MEVFTSSVPPLELTQTFRRCILEHNGSHGSATTRTQEHPIVSVNTGGDRLQRFALFTAYADG